MIVHIFVMLALCGQTPPDPEHLRRTDRGIVIDTPGNPALMTFELTARSVSEYVPLRTALELTLGDEPYEILAVDEVTGRVTLKTTQWGGLSLSGRAPTLQVDALSPKIDQIEPACTHVMAFLGREDPDHADDLVFGEALCPPAQIAEGGESLIVVGLDQAGNQLWVTASEDPRQGAWEAEGPEGPSRVSWRNENDPVWAAIQVPVTDDLRTLRWFEVTPEDRLVLLGESTWRPIAVDE